MLQDKHYREGKLLFYMKTFYFIGVSEETEAKVQDKQVNTREKTVL
jgi:hypothetical protein